MIKATLQKTLNSAEGKMLLDVSMDLEQGDFVVIYGNSGAGKTSILRMIAGLLLPENGTIEVNGSTWFHASKKINLSPQKRNIGIVFQDYALFPNMTVEENLNFALGKNQNRDFVEELLNLMELENLRGQRPQNLSGGQQQRVALARALVRKPEILFLDEPLSALDHKLRNRLQDYILQVHKKYNLTTILVSHDPGEIIKMANRVLVLEQGKITKIGTPLEVFSSKKLSGKFQFTGEVLAIDRESLVSILHILIGNNVIKTVCSTDEILNISAGDKVVVASKAFNPVVTKIE
ncbi:ABC transporter ATP-binding protein [Aequorivita echinoideorum]|uniref:ATP-binding cassette domain-containing protein n=1 Tax=Aequorivita echinoideorum TaxID=1549647 RepID=A0ABS5S4H3_9FLAO|nr:ATP-binding cassette domain-containing protein [Aequorivita echinoideorum]MBT0608121.1 ATP-binding cassette domain-containing protein [Aequorivita echinoideorum]